MRCIGPVRASVKCLLLAAGLSAFATARAEASPFEVYGFGAAGMATAGARTASATDYHAAFYNPAQVLGRKQTHFGLGSTLIMPRIQMTRGRPDSPYESALPANNVGVHVGLSTPLRGPFASKVGLALAAYMPLIHATRMESLDPRVPQAYMYQSLPDKLVIAAAVAYEAAPQVRIGAGIQVLASLTGKADVALSVEQQRMLHRSLRVDFFAVASPTAGIAVDLLPFLTLAAAYRAAIDFRYRLPVHLDILEIGVLNMNNRGVSLWDPHIVDLGATWRLKEQRLTLSATLSVAFWSDAPAPNSLVDITLDDRNLGEDGGGAEDPQPVVELRTATLELGASDILIPKVGVEWAPAGGWVLRAGYSFHPTPLPRATSAATYLDSDTHVVGLGVAWTFGDPFEVGTSPLTVDLGLQWHHPTRRVAAKVDPSNPTGDVAYSGDVLAGVLELRHDL